MMISERFKHEYPISSEDWWNKDTVSKISLHCLKNILNDIECKTVLDWGCGNLMWPIGLFPGAEITGIEKDKKNLKYSKLNADFNNVEFNPIDISEISSIPNSKFDLACSFGLIEFLDENEFKLIHKTIMKSLKPGGHLICVFYNWRPFSALFFPSLLRGGYKKYCKMLRSDISKKSLSNVARDIGELGFEVKKQGAYNPLPSKLWPYSRYFRGYITYNSCLAYFYCSQFILARKKF